jgi:signal transduction histidine kinase/CheY-like chemotaxis protein
MTTPAMTTAATASDSIQNERVRLEQIRAIYKNTPPGTATTFVTVAVLTAGLVYIDAAVRGNAAIFMTVMFVQTAARLLLMRAHSKIAQQPHDWRPWARWFAAGAFVGGITIGVGSIWMMSPDRIDLQLMALLLIFGCTSGAVGAYGTYLPAFYAFFFSISAPPAIWLFAQGDTLHITVGALFVLWFAAVAEQARRSSSDLIELIRLRFANLDLVASLRHEKLAAEEANAAKSRFLAAASHDLRQPVHALSLFVAALRSHEMNSEARGLLDHIDGSVRAMGGLFGGLLDISRLDAGVVDVHRTAFAMQPLIDRVCRDYLAAAREKGLELRVRPTRAVVHSDPILFERILRNIVGNAVAYTDRGKVLVGCRHGRQLRVQVLDSGRGIAHDQRELVFQEFYQVGNAERDRTQGVGLGLAIVKRLTTLLEHALDLRSQPGRGTCFSIDVPRATEAAQATVHSTQALLQVAAQGSGLILVVDDEVAIQVAMKSLLQSWGYSVIAAGSGAEMLERIANHGEVPRLILCDYRLRDNEMGSAVIERLRSEYNDEIPGMLITGDTAPDRLKEAQASGHLLLHKPVPNSKLRAAITHLMQNETAVA